MGETATDLRGHQQVAHMWSRDRNLLATIAKLMSSAYVLSEIKADKKADAFKVKVMQAK